MNDHLVAITLLVITVKESSLILLREIQLSDVFRIN